ncbi:MAG: aminopeptidase [Leptospirales bacterium]
MIKFKRKRETCLVLLGGLFITGVIMHKWVGYVAHLAWHQGYIILNSVQTEDALTTLKLTKEEIQKIELVSDVKQYGKKLYQLEKSKSYENFVPLNRNVLGWNLTAAYPLQLEAVLFSFPFIGDFAYLGFFDEQKKTEWIDRLQQNGYDVYGNEIAAYSTLGYLQDPLFSTYLQLSEYSLARLILHEMSHEKLYFKQDSNFSESLSSFIDDIAAQRFIVDILKKPMAEKPPAKVSDEYESYLNLMQSYRNKLEKLYQSDLSKEYKFENKIKIYLELQNKLKTLAANVKYIQIPEELYAAPLNNAVLIQYGRYQPQGESFQLLFESCKKDIPCWFARLEKMQSCSKPFRKQFLKESTSWNVVKQNCNIE